MWTERGRNVDGTQAWGRVGGVVAFRVSSWVLVANVRTISFCVFKCAHVGEAFRRPRFGSSMVRQQLSSIRIFRGQQDLGGT